MDAWSAWEAELDSMLGLNEDQKRPPQEPDSPDEEMYPALPAGAMRWVQAMALLGVIVMVASAVNWESPDLLKYGAFLSIAILSLGSAHRSAGGHRIILSLIFLFVLFGTLELTRSETVFIAALMALAQRYIQRPPMRVATTIFNVGSAALGATVAHAVYHATWLASDHVDSSVRLAVATSALFLVSTVPASFLIAAMEECSFIEVWRARYLWLTPYYLGGAAVAQVASIASRYVGWQTVLLTGPLLYLLYRTCGLYVQRLEEQKRHAEAMSALHLRTIEALALAIEAKDHTTHDHIRRVQVYAMELARELKFTKRETDALRAAALLHDIGKLAVPEHIISKPGRLTPEEFEKMKIHPVVGAEILERVQFPYPVAPMVRAHHEKWDGTGYPAGLSGENIPMGARIIAAVDCLDALASDRQYRRALPLEEAMKVVVAESGKAFDPQIVKLLTGTTRNGSGWRRSRTRRPTSFPPTLR